MSTSLVENLYVNCHSLLIGSSIQLSNQHGSQWLVRKGNFSLPISNNNFSIRHNDSGTLVCIQIYSSFSPTKGRCLKFHFSNHFQMNFITSLKKILMLLPQLLDSAIQRLIMGQKVFYDLSPALLFSLFYVLRELQLFFHRQSALTIGWLLLKALELSNG